MDNLAEQGQLQYDLWGVTYEIVGLEWAEAQHRSRNSLLVGPMVTVSTSQILGFNKYFEPYTRYVAIFLK